MKEREKRELEVQGGEECKAMMRVYFAWCLISVDVSDKDDRGEEQEVIMQVGSAQRIDEDQEG